MLTQVQHRANVMIDSFDIDTVFLYYPPMTQQIDNVYNFSENSLAKGRVLIIAVGGAGIPKRHENINDNLREGLTLVPYLSDCAARIDYISLAQKDSADLTPVEVANVAKVIQRHQNSHDGFVVIAGTDTMPFTSSATAYALRGLGAPIVFIGSNLNVEEWDTDFRLNLPNAIKVATMGATDVNASSFGEVGILFDDSLSRAVATINRGTRSNNPMITPRVPKLGDVGWTIKLESIAKPRHPSQLNYSYNTNQNLAYFDLVSETHLSTFDQLVDDKFIQGIVIGAFGAGNIPSKMIPSVYRAVYEKGKAVAVITNNKKGSSDMGLYDVGAAAVRAGAISLGPMTKPAAIEKMRYALSNAQGENRLDFLQDVARLLLTSVAEEIPESFSRHAVNQIRDRFKNIPPSLESFYKHKKFAAPEYKVQTYCRSKTAPYKILTISMGGTFYMEVNAGGSLAPTKRPLGDLLDLKFKNLDRLVSLDYIELFNLDSSDVEHPHRAELARTIMKHIKDYDGFVILHGTDTLAYTASALSYMLIGVDKDVMLTGAQKPGYGSSDFDRNFIKSVKAIITRLEMPVQKRIAGGVKVAFGDKLMLGTTVIKEDEHGINAFAPIEKHQLAGKISSSIDLFDITRHIKRRKPTLFTGFNKNVAYFECISGIDVKQFESIIENKDVEAVLIGGYDAGNMPIQLKYYIATAVNSYNKPIVFISHSDNGVAEIVSTGRSNEFIKAGAVALGDMIKESAYQKLCFAMGIANKNNIPPQEKMAFVRKIMHTNFAGEISDRFCIDGDKVYKDIFLSKQFTTEDIDKIIADSTENPNVQNGQKKESLEVKNEKLQGKKN